MSFSINIVELKEIRFHGRGGQGSVSAAALLALAAFEDGYESQAFPKFGSERRGAPVEAYVRISDEDIRVHNQVYQPDALVVQDKTLLHAKTVLQGLKPQGIVVLNSDDPLVKIQGSTVEEFTWIIIPANRISQKILGITLPNTVLLGALAASSGWVSREALENAVATHLYSKGEEVVEANILAVREGFLFGEKSRDSEKDEAVS